MSEELSDKFVTFELKRAESLAVGLPKRPGIDKSVKISETLRFPDYHEPSERWPFIADPLLSKIRKYGRHPPLLTNFGRTKGVPNQRQILHTGPSDRIGSNLTPTARHLRIKAIREERLRKARIRKLMKDDGLFTPKVSAPEQTPKPKKQAPYTKYGKLVSRPPKRPRY